ncbi:MAG: NADH-quinone oxidoreductase subunit C [Candidatus Aminicenantales bacterium]
MPADRADQSKLRKALDALAGRFGDAVLAGAADKGELAVRLTKDVIVPALSFFKDELGFNAFEDLVVFDNLNSPDEGGARFTVVYRLFKFPGAVRARLAVEVEDGESLPSAVPVYRAADWAEREAFDMFGIPFEGHPDLRRIYLPDDFEGHPLRKDFPLAGRTGGL